MILKVMRKGMHTLSKHERLILAVLEEAGEEHLSALAMAVEKLLIKIPNTTQAVSTALIHLIKRDLVGRFIYSVTYFLGCLDRRVAQSPQQSSEILSRETPLERPGDGFIMSLESQ